MKNAYVREDRILPCLPALHQLLTGGEPAAPRRRRTRRGIDTLPVSAEALVRYFREHQITLTYDPAAAALRAGTNGADTTVTLKAS
jgi:hypothetical protein